MSDDEHSRRLRALGLFVKGLVRYGWVVLVAMLLIAGLLEWASWRKLLALGVAGALAIFLSPFAYGVVVAIETRRHNKGTS
jgi:hypothetical protein